MACSPQARASRRRPTSPCSSSAPRACSSCAMAAGGFKEVKPELAEEARDFLLQPSIVRGTFAYWARRCAVTGAEVRRSRPAPRTSPARPIATRFGALRLSLLCSSAFGTSELELAARSVDADAVAILHQRERAAGGGFGRDVADHHAARRAGEAPVGEQRHLLAHALAVEQRGDAEHLAHARPALRAFVADDQHFAFLVARASSPLRRRLSSESNTRARPSNTSDFSPATLISAPSGARLPFSTTSPPVCMIGSFRTTSPSAPDASRSAFSRVDPGKRQAIAVEGTVRQQRLQHRVHAADRVQVLRQEAPAGLHVGDAAACASRRARSRPA